MKKMIFSAALAVFFLLSACSPTVEPGAPLEETDRDAADLKGTIWHLQEFISDGRSEKPLPLTHITLEFSEDQINGWTGCNGFDRGRYTLNGIVLQLDMSEANFSKLDCEPDTAAQEERFLAALAATQGVMEEGDTLTLLYGEGEMIFKRDGTPLDREPTIVDGTRWNLVFIEVTESEEPISLPADIEITADFEQGNLSGSAGCNNYGGPYHLEGETISLGEMAVTAMACEENLMAIENSFLLRLQKVDQLTLNGQELILSGPLGSLVFNPADNLTLEETDWILTGLSADGLAVIHDMLDQHISATFSEGKLSGNGGCNSYGADYTIGEDQSLAFGPVISTQMACDEAVMNREGEFLAALERVEGYRIVRSNLTLTDADGRPVIYFRPPAEAME